MIRLRLYAIFFALLLVEGGASTAGARDLGASKLTFAELGRPDGVIFRANPSSWSASPRMWFELPANVHEGGTNWYVLHLHYRVVLARPTVPGQETILGAATNDVGCAYIRFKSLTPVTTDVAEDGIVNGVVHRKTRSTVISGWFENYLAVAGVRGGKNSLDLIVSQHTGRVVLSASFFADSYIEHVSNGPSVLRLDGLPPSIALKVGTEMTLLMHIRNTGGTAERAVRVLSRASQSGVVRITPAAVGIRALGAGRTRIIRLHVHGRRPGRARLAILVGGATASTGSVMTVVVRR